MITLPSFPLGKTPSAKLDDDARKIYELVVRRFLAIFYPSAEYELTRRVTRIDQDSFRTDGRVLVVPGFLEVYGRKPGVASDKDELVAAEDGALAESTHVRAAAKRNETTGQVHRFHLALRDGDGRKTCR